MKKLILAAAILATGCEPVGPDGFCSSRTMDQVIHYCIADNALAEVLYPMSDETSEQTKPEGTDQ